jgi:hypothetical protein
MDFGWISPQNPAKNMGYFAEYGLFLRANDRK